MMVCDWNCMLGASAKDLVSDCTAPAAVLGPPLATQAPMAVRGASRAAPCHTPSTASPAFSSTFSLLPLVALTFSSQQLGQEMLEVEAAQLREPQPRLFRILGRFRNKIRVCQVEIGLFFSLLKPLGSMTCA